jgi:hypothetical protein
MQRLIKILVSVCSGMMLVFYVQSCKRSGLLEPDNNMEFPVTLSVFQIFQGSMADLIPSTGFTYYEIPTQLFTDYAGKQRLIKLPAGYKMTALNDGLPDLPDGTILVKTFYYFHDQRDTSRGKRIIETRLLVKNNRKWNVATYVWNDDQTEAYLMTAGVNKTVDWINEGGNRRVISYHVPGNRECATCHNNKVTVIPIGVKVRNLNLRVDRLSSSMNQLTYFQNLGILNTVDPTLFSELPDWQDSAMPLSFRARAYLDINCAHCHGPSGVASGTGLFLDYALPFSETKIGSKKVAIDRLMSNGRMPKLGTTIIDVEGLALVKTYLQSL